MPAPIVCCPACHADELAVMPEVSLEMYWSREAGQGAYNGSLTAELRVCPRCGHVSLFARNPTATIGNLGALVQRVRVPGASYRG